MSRAKKNVMISSINNKNLTAKAGLSRKGASLAQILKKLSNSK